MISIIHPSRGRAYQSAETIHKWVNSMADIHNVELIVCCDLDDPKLADYEEVYSRTIFKENPVVADWNESAVDAINFGAKISKGDILIVVSDDTDCFPGWDAFLLKLVEGKSNWILKTQDGIQPWIITMPVMDRQYFIEEGERIYFPEYKHMFCDTELTCRADLKGRKITSNVLFRHLKYQQTPDAISKRADGTWDQGEKLFLERYKRNFDLKPEDIKGKIQDNGMINWLQRKVI